MNYDHSKVGDAFSKAIKAMIVPKNSLSYLHWRNAFVANSNRNISLKLRESNLVRAIELMELAHNALPNNKIISALLSEMRSELP